MLGDTILAATLGLLRGLSVALLLESRRRRIRGPKDLAAIYDLPLPGALPESTALASRSTSTRSGNGSLPPWVEEAFQLIRAHLRYFNVDREVRTLMVTSAAPLDGKTSLARHLAGAVARAGRLVLLIEADLRHPTLAGELGAQSGPGLSDVLIGEQSLRSATQMVDLDAPSVDDPSGQMRLATAAFDVLVAGTPLPPNPRGLLESQAMEELLEHARFTSDLVIIDAPALAPAPVAGALPLLGQVDGVVLVGRVGRHRRDRAEDLVATLASARAPLLAS